MNKIIIGVNAVLIAAVGFLFYKVNTLGGSAQEKQEIVEEAKIENKAEKAKPMEAIGNTPTGKIAFVNIEIHESHKNPLRHISIIFQIIKKSI